LRFVCEAPLHQHQNQSSELSNLPFTESSAFSAVISVLVIFFVVFASISFFCMWYRRRKNVIMDEFERYSNVEDGYLPFQAIEAKLLEVAKEISVGTISLSCFQSSQKAYHEELSVLSNYFT
jgi:hypothetical protein